MLETGMVILVLGNIAVQPVCFHPFDIRDETALGIDTDRAYLHDFIHSMISKEKCATCKRMRVR